MEEGDKPEQTDSISEESLEDVTSQVDDLFVEGETDAPETAVETLSLEEINALAPAGREFKSKEEFAKHWKNLVHFTGKVNSDAKPVAPKAESNQDVYNRLSAMEQRIEQKEFLADNPLAKDHLEVVKAVAKDKGTTLEEAWTTHVKATAEAAAEAKKGRNVGVNSKTRISPQVSERMKATEDAARQGNPQAQDELVAGFLKNAGLG